MKLLKKAGLAGKTAIILALIMVIGTIAGCGESKSIISSTPTASETKAPETTTEEETTQEESDDGIVAPTEPITFYLFGVDTQSYSEIDDYRSDIIKVVQIDPVKRTIKFIAILRDTKAPIEGYPDQKINAAFQYGGADFAMDTINKDFGLDIHDYIMVNFYSAVVLVDYIGGVDIDLTQEEADAINEHDGDFVGDGRQLLCVPVKEGLCHLDGTQTLAFCRTRKIDSDFFRADRQHKVLKEIIKNIGNIDKSQYADIVGALFWNTKVSFDIEDVLKWTKLDIQNYEFSSYTVPDALYETDAIGGLDETDSWVWQYDLKAAGERINSILDGTFVSREDERTEDVDAYGNVGQRKGTANDK